MKKFLYPHQIIHVLTLFIALAVTPIAQFEINTWQSIAQSSQIKNLEDLARDIWSMTQRIACDGHSLILKEVDCNKGYWQSEARAGYRETTNEYSEKINKSRYKSALLSFIIGFSIILSVYAQYRFDFKNDLKRKEYCKWIDILKSNKHVRVRLKAQ